jgi:NAD(P)-dependent dehydrogenase (short-subunit alcohol dehydrogenase family)
VIVFISAVNGWKAGGGYAHCTAASTASSPHTHCRVELGPHGIRAPAVCPGFIDTTMHDYQGSYDMMVGAAPREGAPEARSSVAPEASSRVVR